MGYNLGVKDNSKTEDWPRESAVEALIEKHLIDRDYIIVPKDRRKKKTRGPGVDIQAYKKTKSGNYSSSYFIECKGKTKNSYVASNEIFGQILKRMKDKTYAPQVFVVAFPDIREFRVELEKIPIAVIRKLSREFNLKIWFVNRGGKIERYK